MDGGGVFKIVKSAGQTQGHVMNSFPDFQLLSVLQLRRARFDTRAQTDEAFVCRQTHANGALHSTGRARG